MKRLGAALALSISVVVAGMFALPSDGVAGGCSGPAKYNWSGTVIPYGVRDFNVSFCGPDSLDAYAGAEWRGNKKLSVVLIEPDGTIHSSTGTGAAAGELEGPLASGDWTILVRNLGSSNVRFAAELSFE